MNAPDNKQQPKTVAGYIGLCWFKREHFADHRQLMSDPDELFDTYDEWLKSAHQIERTVAAQGHRVVRVPFDPVSFLLLCTTRGMLPDAKARSQWAAMETERRYRHKVRG
ncbi:MAG: hypothetical protein JNM13_05345 [Hyphomicrobiaceae bacterium]|nr:hypothetical protein [Hyphomicrobiaceae bacterium]